jgi:hypothetical protein
MDSFFNALQLMAAGDAEIWWTIGNSMRLAFLSILCAAPPGVFFGTALSLGRFRGKKALVALCGRGIGPDTASRILASFQQDEDDFLREILVAEINYAKTKRFWD